ncbi:hypothetical protein [Deinococcus radiotolerans]|uniref:Uncharacterized protein n=1 Tax=Deinococcus radiotolerans TaxID=1309407 RepID=A0ABQ2FRR3_9DEIO|nr:hypothetical protein [Deinococcus radiotolerans]GGL20416.1 hypothetical protein GCM10010844_44120 [Deinococcus radiotolerans]
MRTLTLTVLLLTEAASMAARTPPTACTVQARLIGGRSALGQYRLEIRVPDTCPYGEERLARIFTRGGGRIPPVGYFRLGAGYPRKVSYWVFPGAKVQDRAAPNVWNTVPLEGAPAWW